MHRPKLIWNLLVLTTVIGLVLTGWLVGHILRFSSPALRHPPVEGINPQIEIGSESEGIQRQAVLMGLPLPAHTLAKGRLSLTKFFSETALGIPITPPCPPSVAPRTGGWCE